MQLLFKMKGKTMPPVRTKGTARRVFMRAILPGLLIAGAITLLSCGEDSRGNYADSVTRDFNACICTEENGNRSWVVSCTDYPQSCASPTEEDITENLYVRCEDGGRVQTACTEGCGGLPVFCGDDTYQSVFSCPPPERLLCVQRGITRAGTISLSAGLNLIANLVVNGTSADATIYPVPASADGRLDINYYDPEGNMVRSETYRINETLSETFDFRVSH